MVKFGGLRTRMVVFFSLLLIVVQGIAFVLLEANSRQISERNNVQQLEAGERIFSRLLLDSRDRLSTAGEVLARDFGFRAAAASSDSATILSALANHGARIGANMMALVSPEGDLVECTLGDISIPDSGLRKLVSIAEQKGEAFGLIQAHSNVYQAAIIPVLAPDLLAWVVIGFAVDDAVAHDLKSLTRLEVSFLFHIDGAWRVLGSTRSSTIPGELTQWFSESWNAGNAKIGSPIMLDGFATMVTPLPVASALPTFAVLQRPTHAVAEQIERLRTTLAVIAAISLAFSVLGAVVIAHGITRPLVMLADVASKIRDGDYSHAAKIAERDEIGLLAESFNQMRDSISVLLRLAYRDPLSKLPNRAMFNDRLVQTLKAADRNGEPFALLMIDLDRFKAVNDELGHEAGDQVIRTIGERLPAALRESDTAARLGGDEFAVILPNTSLETVRMVAKKTYDTLVGEIPLANGCVKVGYSIGVAIYPDHGAETTTLLRHADEAMYAAKRAGTEGVYIYSPKGDYSGREKPPIGEEIRRALRDNEFELHFLPVIDLVRSKVVAIEALTHWRHRTRGVLPPEQFIGAIENAGLIGEFTKWLIHSALSQCARWLADGHTIAISVNLSEQDLSNPDLPAIVDESLRSTGVSPAMLLLEIPERAVYGASPERETVIEKLSDLGVALSIDDYGASHSALSYVRRLPLSELKIDRAFISDMTRHPQGEALVRLAIEFGHSLGYTMVAEGVESALDLDRLQGLGCDRAQGFAVTEPLDADSMSEWISKSPWGSRTGSGPNREIA